MDLEEPGKVHDDVLDEGTPAKQGKKPDVAKFLCEMPKIESDGTVVLTDYFDFLFPTEEEYNTFFQAYFTTSNKYKQKKKEKKENDEKEKKAAENMGDLQEMITTICQAYQHQHTTEEFKDKLLSVKDSSTIRVYANKYKFKGVMKKLDFKEYDNMLQLVNTQSPNMDFDVLFKQNNSDLTPAKLILAIKNKIKVLCGMPLVDAVERNKEPKIRNKKSERKQRRRKKTKHMTLEDPKRKAGNSVQDVWVERWEPDKKESDSVETTSIEYGEGSEWKLLEGSDDGYITISVPLSALEWKLVSFQGKRSDVDYYEFKVSEDPMGTNMMQKLTWSWKDTDKIFSQDDKATSLQAFLQQKVATSYGRCAIHICYDFGGRQQIREPVKPEHRGLYGSRLKKDGVVYKRRETDICAVSGASLRKSKDIFTCEFCKIQLSNEIFTVLKGGLQDPRQRFCLVDKNEWHDQDLDESTPLILQRFMELEQDYETIKGPQTQAQPSAVDVQEGDEIEISEFFCFWQVNFEQVGDLSYSQQYNFLISKDNEAFDPIPKDSKINDKDVQKAFNDSNQSVRVKFSKQNGDELSWEQNLRVDMGNGTTKVLTMYEVQLQNDTNNFFEYSHDNEDSAVFWNFWYKHRYNDLDGAGFEEYQANEAEPVIVSQIRHDGHQYEITFSVDHDLSYTPKFRIKLSPGENGLFMTDIKPENDNDDKQGKNPLFPMTGKPKLEIFEDLGQLPEDSQDVKAGLVWMIPDSNFFASNKVREVYTEITAPQTVNNENLFRLKFTMHEMKTLVQTVWGGKWPLIRSYFMYQNRPYIPVSFMKRTSVAHVSGGCMYLPENSGVFCDPRDTATMLKVALNPTRFSKDENPVFLFENIKLQQDFTEVEEELRFVEGDFDIDFLSHGSNDPEVKKLLSKYQDFHARLQDKQFLAKLMKIQGDIMTVQYLEDSQNLSGSQTIYEILQDQRRDEHTKFVDDIVSKLKAEEKIFVSQIEKDDLKDFFTEQNLKEHEEILVLLNIAMEDYRKQAEKFWKKGDEKDLNVKDHVCVLAMKILINKSDWKFAENFVIWDDCPSRKFDDNIVGFETTEAHEEELGKHAHVVKDLCPQCEDVMIHRRYSEANVLHPRTRFELMQCLYYQYEREKERHRNHEYLTRSECVEEKKKNSKQNKGTRKSSRNQKVPEKASTEINLLDAIQQLDLLYIKYYAPVNEWRYVESFDGLQDEEIFCQHCQKRGMFLFHKTPVCPYKHLSGDFPAEISIMGDIGWKNIEEMHEIVRGVRAQDTNLQTLRFRLCSNWELYANSKRIYQQNRLFLLANGFDPSQKLLGRRSGDEEIGDDDEADMNNSRGILALRAQKEMAEQYKLMKMYCQSQANEGLGTILGSFWGNQEEVALFESFKNLKKHGLASLEELVAGKAMKLPSVQKGRDMSLHSALNRIVEENDCLLEIWSQKIGKKADKFDRDFTHEAGMNMVRDILKIRHNAGADAVGDDDDYQWEEGQEIEDDGDDDMEFYDTVAETFDANVVSYEDCDDIAVFKVYDKETETKEQTPKFGLRWLRLDSATSSALVTKREEEKKTPSTTIAKDELRIKAIQHNKMTQFFVKHLVPVNEIMTITPLRFWLEVQYVPKDIENKYKDDKLSDDELKAKIQEAMELNAEIESFTTNECFYLTAKKVKKANMLLEMDDKESDWRTRYITFQALLSRPDAGVEDLDESVNQSIESVMTGDCELKPENVHLYSSYKLLQNIERMFQDHILRDRDVFNNELRIPITELFACFYKKEHADDLKKVIEELKEESDDPMKLDKITYFLYLIANIVHGKRFEVEAETVHMLKRIAGTGSESETVKFKLEWVKANKDQLQYVLGPGKSMHIRSVPEDIMQKNEVDSVLENEWKQAVSLQREDATQASSVIPDMFPILVHDNQDTVLDSHDPHSEFRIFKRHGNDYKLMQHEQGVLNSCWQNLLPDDFQLVVTETFDVDSVLNWDGKMALESKAKSQIESNTVIRLKKDAMQFLVNRNLIDLEMVIDTKTIFKDADEFETNMQTVINVLEGFFSNAFDTALDEIICIWGPHELNENWVVVKVKSARIGTDQEFQVTDLRVESNEKLKNSVVIKAKTNRVLNQDMRERLRSELENAIDETSDDIEKFNGITGNIQKVIFPRNSTMASQGSDVVWNTLIKITCRDIDSKTSTIEFIENNKDELIRKLHTQVNGPDSTSCKFTFISAQTDHENKKSAKKSSLVYIVVQSSSAIPGEMKKPIENDLKQFYYETCGVKKVNLDSSKNQIVDSSLGQGEQSIFVRVIFEAEDMANQAHKMLTEHHKTVMDTLNGKLKSFEEKAGEIYPVLISDDKDMESNEKLLRRQIVEALYSKFKTGKSRIKNLPNIVPDHIKFNDVNEENSKNFKLPEKDFFVGRITAVREEENTFFVYSADLEHTLCVNLVVWKRNSDNIYGWDLKKFVDFDFFLYQPVVAAVAHDDDHGIGVSSGAVGKVAKITDDTLTINWGETDVTVAEYSTTTKEFSLLINFKPDTPGSYYEADKFVPEPGRTRDFQTALETFVYDADADAEFNPFFYTTRLQPTIFESMTSHEIISKEIVPHDIQVLMTSAIHEYDIMKLITAQASLSETRSKSAAGRYDEDLDSPQEFLAFVSDIRESTSKSLYDQTRKVFDTYGKSHAIQGSTALNICDVIDEEKLKQEWRRISNNFRNSKQDLLGTLEELGFDNQGLLAQCQLFREWSVAKTAAKKSVDAFRKYCNWILNNEKKKLDDENPTPEYSEAVYIRKIAADATVWRARKQFESFLLTLEQDMLKNETMNTNDVWKKMLHEGTVMGQNDSSTCIFFEPNQGGGCELSEYFFFTLKRVACIKSKVHEATDEDMLAVNSGALLQNMYAKIVNFLRGICPKKSLAAQLTKMCKLSMEDGDEFEATLSQIIQKMGQLSESDYDIPKLKLVTESFKSYFECLQNLKPVGIIDDTIFEGESFVIFDPLCLSSIVDMFEYFIANGAKDNTFPFAFGVWKEIMRVLTQYFKDDNQFGPYSKFDEVATQGDLIQVLELIMQWYTQTFFVKQVIHDKQETAIHRKIYLNDDDMSESEDEDYLNNEGEFNANEEQTNNTMQTRSKNVDGDKNLKSLGNLHLEGEASDEDNSDQDDSEDDSDDDDSQDDDDEESDSDEEDSHLLKKLEEKIVSYVDKVFITNMSNIEDFWEQFSGNTESVSYDFYAHDSDNASWRREPEHTNDTPLKDDEKCEFKVYNTETNEEEWVSSTVKNVQHSGDGEFKFSAELTLPLHIVQFDYWKRTVKFLKFLEKLQRKTLITSKLRDKIKNIFSGPGSDAKLAELIVEAQDEIKQANDELESFIDSDEFGAFLSDDNTESLEDAISKFTDYDADNPGGPVGASPPFDAENGGLSAAAAAGESMQEADELAETEKIQRLQQKCKVIFEKCKNDNYVLLFEQVLQLHHKANMTSVFYEHVLKPDMFQVNNTTLHDNYKLLKEHVQECFSLNDEAKTYKMPAFFQDFHRIGNKNSYEASNNKVTLKMKFTDFVEKILNQPNIFWKERELARAIELTKRKIDETYPDETQNFSTFTGTVSPHSKTEGVIMCFAKYIDYLQTISTQDISALLDSDQSHILQQARKKDNLLHLCVNDDWKGQMREAICKALGIEKNDVSTETLTKHRKENYKTWIHDLGKILTDFAQTKSANGDTRELTEMLAKLTGITVIHVRINFASKSSYDLCNSQEHNVERDANFFCLVEVTGCMRGDRLFFLTQTDSLDENSSDDQEE